MLELEIEQADGFPELGSSRRLQVAKPVATTPLELAAAPSATTMKSAIVATPPIPAALSHDIVVPTGVSGMMIVHVVGVPPPTGTASTSMTPLAQPETLTVAKTEYTVATLRTLICCRRPNDPENEHGASSSCAPTGDGDTVTTLPTRPPPGAASLRSAGDRSSLQAPFCASSLTLLLMRAGRSDSVTHQEVRNRC